MSGQERKQDPLLAWAVARYNEIRRRRRARRMAPSPPIPSIIFINTMAEEANKKQQSSKRRGIANYSYDERMHFMRVMEKIRPIGGEDWKKVEEIHAKRYKDKERDFGSLRRKYQKLAQKGAPTGDPTVPEDIALARRVKQLISDRMNLGTGSERYDLETGFESEQNLLVDVDEDPPEENPPPDDIPLGQPSQDETITQEETQTQQETQTQIVDVDDVPPAPLSFSTPKSVGGYSTPSQSKRSYNRSASSSLESKVESIMEVIAVSLAKTEKEAEERRRREDVEREERRRREEMEVKQRKLKEEKEERDRKREKEEAREERQREKEEAREERQNLYAVITALAQGVTTAWTGAQATPTPTPPARRKRRRDGDE